MSIDAIIQCRFNSTRLPAKILLPLNENICSLDFLLENLRSIKSIKNIIISTPDDQYKDLFEAYAKKHNVKFYSPNVDPKNVLKRFYLTSKKYKSNNILRITSDCPFINIHLVSEMIQKYTNENLEFLTNNSPRFVPHGFDCEIFSRALINKIYKNAKTKFDREHVTTWLRKKNPRKILSVKIYKKNYSRLRITLDYESDYNFFIRNFKFLKKLSKSVNHEKLIKGFLKSYKKEKNK